MKGFDTYLDTSFMSSVASTDENNTDALIQTYDVML